MRVTRWPEMGIKLRPSQAVSLSPSKRTYEHAVYRQDQRKFGEVWFVSGNSSLKSVVALLPAKFSRTKRGVIFPTRKDTGKTIRGNTGRAPLAGLRVGPAQAVDLTIKHTIKSIV